MALSEKDVKTVRSKKNPAMSYTDDDRPETAVGDEALIAEAEDTISGGRHFRKRSQIEIKNKRVQIVFRPSDWEIVRRAVEAEGDVSFNEWATVVLIDEAKKALRLS